MSVLIAGMTSAGIVIASDTRSVKELSNGQFFVETDDFEKTFVSDDLIVGTWGANSVSRYGKEKPIGDMMRAILAERPYGATEFLSLMSELHAKGAYELVGDSGFVFCDKREPGPKLYEASFTGGVLKLNAVTFGPTAVRTYATTGLFPDYSCVDYSVPFDEFARRIGDMVEAAIEFGRILEKKGIVKKYHVGGKVNVKTLRF